MPQSIAWTSYFLLILLSYLWRRKYYNNMWVTSSSPHTHWYGSKPINVPIYINKQWSQLGLEMMLHLISLIWCLLAMRIWYRISIISLVWVVENICTFNLVRSLFSSSMCTMLIIPKWECFLSTLNWEIMWRTYLLMTIGTSTFDEVVKACFPLARACKSKKI